MSTVAFITELRKQGIRIWVEEGRLLFSAPNGVMTPEIRQELAARKGELTTFLLESGAEQSAPASLQAAPKSETYPLSLSQAALWFIHQANPGTNAYNMFDALRLRGPLNADALERALQEIVKRHESLRTVFGAKDGQPFQRIQPPGGFALLRSDLRTVPETERETQLRTLAEAEVQKPFALADGPLFRASLYQLAPDHHVLLLAMHHAISDGWSTGVLRQDLAALYTAFSRGEGPPCPPLLFQFVDYAFSQRRFLETDEFKKHVAYWRQRLKAMPSTLDLPTDRPRPPIQTFRGRTVSFDIPADLRTGLTAVGKRQDCSLFMVLLAAFNVLLGRYSSEEDIIVGVPVAGRNLPETENIYGFFVNILALRTDLAGNPTFRQLLGRLRENFLEALSHQDVPFEKLVAELQPKRDQSRNPIFQVSFSCDVATPDLALPGIESSFYPVERGASHFDMTFFIEETKNGIGGKAEYDCDLFDAATIDRFIGNYLRLLEGILAKPDSSLSSLPILTAAEEKCVLLQWNETRTDYPRNACVHELYEQQAAKTPDAVAVVMGALDAQGRPTAVLTYAALNERANRLAHHLRNLGVGPEVFVGVFMERSLDTVVAILAILKAGGAYVPLDPTYPKSRLAFMLKDTGAPVLLTQSSLAKDLPDYGGRVVELDRDWESIAQESAANGPNQTTADHLAYVIYTSGSTGNPKGVCVPHRGVVRLVKATDYVDLSAREVLLQFAPISFDASTFEIWASLLNGARLVVFPPELPTLEQLGQIIRDYGITTLWLTASLFREMVDTRVEDLRGVRQLLAGGEALSVRHVQRALQELPATRLINGYGPTENTTFTCCHTIKPESVGQSVPIGRPIANTTVYVLDRHLQPVPVGVPGEIYTGGDGLARGYLNAPELTAAKFIRNPFSSDPNDRLYRVGDLARYLPTGDIEFLGRTDNQVKVRGFRIELGEIETHLQQHPAVQQAVVALREDTPGNKTIAAYLVARASAALNAAGLRSFLKQRLPDYMIPSAFVTLDEIPLTANGKVDRKALPEPCNEKAGGAGEDAARRSRTEEQLCRIWAEIFGRENIGVHEDFFELGGHSLMTLRAIALINDRLGARLQPATFFDHPTIAGLAALLESDRGKRAPPASAQSATSSAQPRPSAVDLDAIAAVVAYRGARALHRDRRRPYRMRESLICRYLLAPLFEIGSGRIRDLLQLVILKLEGGPLFTITLRKLYRKCFEIDIGDYSAGGFDPHRIQLRTRIGRYSGIYHTVVIRNADHPRNTISTHSVFYHPAFGYAKGYDPPRMRVEIGNDVWIGHNATILYPTQKIGDGAVIAVGSVVVEDVPPYAIVGGYPAKVLRYRFSKEKIEQLLKSRWWEASLEELEPIKDQFARPLEGDSIR